MEHINGIKAAVTAFFGMLTALWGWYGWLVLAWVFCMALDYVTGTCAAWASGSWSSSVARDGVWHKVGCIVAVMLASLLDLVVELVLGNFPGITFPFVYNGLLGPLVLMWYILTEAGSIVENVGELGAPVPDWLKSAIEKLKDRVNEQADNEEE